MTTIRIIVVIFSLQTLLLGETPFNYNSARARIEHDCSNSKVPVGRRFFISGPEQVVDHYFLNGKPMVRSIEQSRMAGYNPRDDPQGTNALTVVKMCGLFSEPVIVLVYHAEQPNDPVVVATKGLVDFKRLIDIKIKPLDVVRFLYPSDPARPNLSPHP